MTNVDELQANKDLLDLNQDNDRRSILFVSPYEEERMLFEMVCEHDFPDFSFETEPSVNNAIERLKKELRKTIALVISDMGIHYSKKELGKRGDHLVEEMRESGLDGVPVILHSADNRYSPDSPFGDRKALEDLIKIDGVEYLHKPFEIDEFREAVCGAVKAIRERPEDA